MPGSEHRGRFRRHAQLPFEATASSTVAAYGSDLLAQRKSLFAVASQVREAGHGQQRENVSQVLVIEDDNGCPAHCDLIALAHLIPRAISHPDLERNPLVYRRLDLVTGHRCRLPICLQRVTRASWRDAD